MATFLKHISIDNRKSRFNYEYMDIYTAGIKLTGTEIKSIMTGEVSIDDAFCIVTENGIIIRNMYIKEYEFGNRENHEPKGDRILLLNKSELRSLRVSLINKGLTVIPIKLFRNSRGLIKLQVALCRGKKTHDKKESIKKRDIEREIKRDFDINI